MMMGTKSVLYGAHCFFLHPWFVAWAWWKLYGFPWDPRLWVAFFVHDLGYWGKPDMDGPEGEMHPMLGADIMGALFDRERRYPFSRQARFLPYLMDHVFGDRWAPIRYQGVPASWYQFVFYHSRFLSKRYHMPPSTLCMADKLAIVLTPAWLYLPMVRATGEIKEYRAHAKHRDGGTAHQPTDEEWYESVRNHMRAWVAAHKDGAPDTWTSDPDKRATVDETGVWK